MLNNNRLPKSFEYRVNFYDDPGNVSVDPYYGPGGGHGAPMPTLGSWDHDAPYIDSQINSGNTGGISQINPATGEPTGQEGYIDADGNFVQTGSNNAVSRFFTKISKYWADSDILSNIFGAKGGKALGTLMTLTVPQISAVVGILRAGYTVGKTALSYSDGISLGLSTSEVDGVNQVLTQLGSEVGDNPEAYIEIANSIEAADAEPNPQTDVYNQAVGGLDYGKNNRTDLNQNGMDISPGDHYLEGQYYITDPEYKYLVEKLGGEAALEHGENSTLNPSDLVNMAIEQGIPLPMSMVDRGLKMNPESTYYVDAYGNVSDTETGDAVIGMGEDGAVNEGVYLDHNGVWNAGFDENGNAVVDGEYEYDPETGGVTLPEEDTTKSTGSNPVESTIPDLYIPDSIPDDLTQGMQNYSDQTRMATDAYNQKADGLWSDYLEFEKVFFDKYEGVQNEHNQNIASMPTASMTLPGVMGGGNFDLAPTAHANMYNNIATTKNNLINNQAATQFSSLGARGNLNNNILGANLAQAGFDFMPTQTGLDLYKMERAAELGLESIEAQQPSILSQIAPIFGGLLSSNGEGGTVLGSVWDAVTRPFG